MKKLMILIVMTLLLVSSGCISNDFANKQLIKCPDYFQKNIGEIKAEPFSPLSLVLGGYVKSGEPNQPIHLFGLANKFTVWHEAFHSFEFRIFNERPCEWELFRYDFEDDFYLGNLVTVAMLFVPFIEQIPIPGKVRLYSSFDKFEDSADCFAYWMQNKNKHQRKDLQPKLKAIEKFVSGFYNGEMPMK